MASRALVRRLGRRSLAGLVTLVFLFNNPSIASAQGGQIRLNVNELVGSGLAWISGSPHDLGSLPEAFDGRTETLYRSAGVNPARIQVAFQDPVTVSQLRIFLSDGSYRVRIEAADSEEDLEEASGSYHLIQPYTDTPTDEIVNIVLPEPVTARIFHFRTQKVGSDGFVHIRELQFVGEVPAGLLADPRGIALADSSRIYVAESGAGRIAVFDSGGARLASIGEPGAGDGQLNEPWDVAVGAAGDLYVADRGNDRISVFGPDGAFLNCIGAPGNAAGEFDGPSGLAIDAATGAILVADAFNHRVQRFSANGTLDPSWGNGGVVGTTGIVKRDHTGFDTPSAVAIEPVSREIFVADRGNQRIEVFDHDGAYVRTHHAVYMANGLAFDAQRNLFIAGEDPNDGYPPYDGRLRMIAFGDELITRHFTGGLDDLSRSEGGVAIRGDGRIFFTDTRAGRIRTTDGAFADQVSNLSVDPHGSSVRLRWHTAIPAPSAVRFAYPPAGHSRTDPFSGSVTTSGNEPSTEHDVTIQGVSSNQRLYYGLAFPDPFDGSVKFTKFNVLNTGVTPGDTQFLRLKAVGVVYTDEDGGAGYRAMSDAAREAALTRFQRVAAFYWRNSRFHVWLDFTVVQVDRNLVDEVAIDHVEADLSALGYGPLDDFDAVYASAVPTPFNGGGLGGLYGRAAGVAIWTTQTDFVAIHEINHTIDAIYGYSEIYDYQFAHGIWAVDHSIGGQVSVNGAILRNVLPATLTAISDPFDKVLSAPDADQDGVPDTSPPGLTTPLPITEQSLGSFASSPDSDGDGRTDFEEATALPYHGTNLLDRDSDGDGTDDPADGNPLYPIADRIGKATPTIDGVIADGEPWTVLTSGWGFSNDGIVDDDDALQADATTYAAWDETYFYLALRGAPSYANIAVDGDADNIYFGPANFWLTLANAESRREVKVNVGVPDLFRMIDGDGQWSEIFDNDPLFTSSYTGTPFADGGAGFPARLLTEEDLLYESALSNGDSTWEAAIPWSNATAFHGFAGKRIALSIMLDDDWGFTTPDALFETDSPAVLELADGAPNVDHTCRGLKATIVGGEGDDVLYGTSADDVIVGLGGNDEIHAGSGNDVVCGGAGDDAIDGEYGDDLLDGGPGRDAIWGTSGRDVIDGGDGGDELHGGSSADRINGGAGDDNVFGGPGDDTVEGCDGNDVLRGSTGDDVLSGGAGRDTLSGGEDDDELAGGDGDDSLMGGPGRDRLRGEAGDDIVRGSDGNDYLDGGYGFDRLYGGEDDDRCVRGEHLSSCEHHWHVRGSHRNLAAAVRE